MAVALKRVKQHTQKSSLVPGQNKEYNPTAPISPSVTYQTCIECTLTELPLEKKTAADTMSGAIGTAETRTAETRTARRMAAEKFLFSKLPS